VQPTTTISDRPRTRAVVPSLARLRSFGAEAAVRLAVPVAVLAAGWSLAVFCVPAGGSSGAETSYLTLLATGVLTAVALLTPRPGLEVGVAGTLAVLLLWVMPSGPSRGAGLTVLLLATLGVAAIRYWGPRRHPRLHPLLAGFAAIFGVQLLMRAEDLLHAGPDPATVGRFLLLPALAATALAVIARTSGAVPALIAGAAVATVGGGWGTGPVLALTALAGGAVLANPLAVVSKSETDASPISGARVVLVRAAAGIALAAPLFWQQRAGAVAAAAGLALALAERLPVGTDRTPRDPGWLRAALPLVPMLAVGVGAAALPLHPWNEAWETALRLPVWIPALVVAVRGRPVLAVAAFGLAVAAGRGAPEPAMLAAPVALAALSLPAARSPERTAAAGTILQAVWSLALLGVATLAATYPWLRSDPLKIAAGAFGLGSASGGGSDLAPAAPVAAMALLLLLALLPAWLSRRGVVALSPRRLVLIGAGALALLLVVHLPSTPRTVIHPGGRQILDVASPELEMDLDGHEIRRVILDTHLTHAGELLPGVPVAVLRLEDRSGTSLAWPLRMGEETGEWAAARPDLARRATLAAPEPWLSQVVETSEEETPEDATDRRFFARRYRTVLDVDEARPAEAGPALPGRVREPVRLVLVRSPALPPDVTLAVFHLETRP
jgi:hypothetical protein